jgi:streptogramin lyase
MGSSMRLFRLLSVLSALSLLQAGLSGVARGQEITEFPIGSTGGGEGRIAVGPDGNLWFVQTGSNEVGRITTAGDFTAFPIPTSDSSPQDIVAGPDENLWFTEWDGNKIGRITPAGVITEFPLPGSGSGPRDIVAGPDGNLWFTESADKIGRITPAGVIDEVPLRVGFSPFGIAVGPDRALWFTGYYSDRIGRVTTDLTVFEEWETRQDTWPSAIAPGPDGNLWFTESDGHIGRISPARVIEEFPLPAGPSGFQPSDIAAGPDGNLWVTSSSFGAIGILSMSGDLRVILPPDRGVRPSGITAGPDGNLWFTEAAGRMVGRIQLVQPGPCVAGPTTLCLSGGRFRVEAAWQAPTRGTSGRGQAIPLTDGTGAFWFFDASSIEVFVKVLDGCSINGRSWIFAGGLTNVGVTLTVIDTQAGQAKTYVNPAGTAFQPVQDTAAFAACP